VSDERAPRSVLEDGVEDLSRVVEGVAGLLLGRTGDAESPEPGRPVISDDVDQAIQDLGGAVGQVLLAAGDHLQRTAGDEPQGATEDTTPLVHGARSLSRGLGALAADLLGGLQGKHPPDSDPSEAPGDDTA